MTATVITAIKPFVSKRFEDMEATPRAWATSTAGFGMQLVAFAEATWVGRAEDFRRLRRRDMLAEVFGTDVPPPDVLLEDDWARERVVIARKYLAP